MRSYFPFQAWPCRNGCSMFGLHEKRQSSSWRLRLEVMAFTETNKTGQISQVDIYLPMTSSNWCIFLPVSMFGDRLFATGHVTWERHWVSWNRELPDRLQLSFAQTNLSYVKPRARSLYEEIIACSKGNNFRVRTRHSPNICILKQFCGPNARSVR